MLKALILAGGAGTRLWPLSRRATPKYLLNLLGSGTLLADTVARAAHRLPLSDIHLITPVERVDDIRRALPQLPPANIIPEPLGRDSAACIGYGALRLAHDHPDALILVMPVDHIVKPVERFWAAVDAALPVARTPGNLLTFGVKPSWPSTQLGYLQRAEKISQLGGLNVFKLKCFREKPDLAAARQFLAQGDFYWNAGIFLWRAQTILDQIRTHLRAHADILDAISRAIGTPGEQSLIHDLYPRFERISIDFGVMEKAHSVFVVETDFAWDDVGTWVSVAQHHPSDPAGNTFLGPHVAIDTSNTIIRAAAGHLVATIGLDDLVIIHTPDATLVARRDRAADVRKLVAELERLGLDHLL